MTKSKFYTLVALVVLAGLVILGRQFATRIQLRAQNDALRLQVDRLAAENRHVAPEGPASTDSASSVNVQLDELRSLRSQVGDQQKQIQELQAELAAQPTLPSFQSLSGSNRFVNLPKESWTAAGYGTPEAALESMLWATAHGDVNAVRASLTPAELQRRNNGAWKGLTDHEIAEAGEQGLSQVSGLQILNIQITSDTTAHFTVYVTGLPQADQPLWMDLTQIDGQWKSDGSEHRLAGR